MSDVEILRSGETMVSHVSGETEAGIEFVDEYIPTREGAALDMQVIDRMILPNGDIDDFVSACQRQGLTVERTEGI